MCVPDIRSLNTLIEPIAAGGGFRILLSVFGRPRIQRIGEDMDTTPVGLIDIYNELIPGQQNIDFFKAILNIHLETFLLGPTEVTLHMLCNLTGILLEVQRTALPAIAQKINGFLVLPGPRRKSQGKLVNISMCVTNKSAFHDVQETNRVQWYIPIPQIPGRLWQEKSFEPRSVQTAQPDNVSRKRKV